MTSSNQKIVYIDQPKQKTSLTQEQRLFNSLSKKIETQKNILLEWQTFTNQFQTKIANEYEIKLDLFNQLRTELVAVLDSFYAHKIFKQKERQKISYLISEIAFELIEEFGKHELIELYDRHSPYDYKTVIHDNLAMANEVFKTMAEAAYGVELDEELDSYSPDKYAEILENLKNKHEENHTLAKEGFHKNQKKTKKQLDKEAKQEQEELNLKLSIREVYRKLISALHPDREQNQIERERKTEIMQRVNTAYAKKDLLSLLALQLEVEQIDQTHLNNIAEDRLKYFNKLLKNQLQELQMEVAALQYPFKIQLDLPPFANITKQQLVRKLDSHIKFLELDILDIKKELKLFTEPTALKTWLKTYKIPIQNENVDHYDFNDLMPRY